MRNIDPMAKEGMRIRMIHMDDERPVDEGLEGTIEKIDDLGTLHVRWDDGRLLGVIPNEDDYELLPSNEEQIDFDVFEGKEFKTSVATKNNKMAKKVNLNFKRELSKLKPRPKLESKEEINGGKAEGMTTKDLAKKHDVSVKDIEKEIKVGVEIEMEHTDSKKIAKEIAMDHIAEFPDYYTNKKYGLKASEKGLEKDLEETTTAGAAGAFVAPLGNKKDVVRKGFAKQLGTNVVSKGSMKNPLGKIYTLSKKNESKIIKASDILKEMTTSASQKLRDKPGAMDGDAWVGKNGWERKDELLWPGGEIADVMAKLDIDWNDSDLTLTDAETDAINEVSMFKRKKKIKSFQDYNDYINGIDTTVTVYQKGDKFLVTRRGHEEYVIKTFDNVEDALRFASDMTNEEKFRTEPEHFTHNIEESKKKKVKKNKDEEEDLEEATTFNSVFGGGFPVTPFMWAKKGKHGPSKKSLYKGGKIVQKVGGDGILSEENEVKDSPFPGLTSTELREILTYMGLQNVKYVKNDTYSTDSNEDFVRNSMKHKPKILQGYMELAKTEEPLITSLNGKTYIVWKKLGGSTLFNEINKIKWVKGGKFVKIKDRCAKYNNKPWCSQGAVDNPLELSDTVFENIKKVSKKTGLSEENILDKIKAKLKGVSKEQMEYNKEHGLPIWWQGSKEGFYEYMEPRKNNTGSN